MRIGVITYWYSEENYGQILQCYALQQFLRNMGHEAFLIKYKAASYKVRQMRFQDIRYLIFKIFYLLNKDNILMSMHFRKHSPQLQKSVSRHFDTFRELYIRSTERIYDQHSLYDNPPDADIYITGSDQVWRMPDSCYFLDFAPHGKMRIAYAPSFGNDHLPYIFRSIIRRFVSKFNTVTVREKSGLRICRTIGRNDAILVPDPTFLLNVSQYEKLMAPSSNHSSERYVFVYILGNKTEYNIEQLFEWAKQHNLIVKHVASCGANQYDVSIYPSIEEWLRLIRNAEYVVTNSFHGMVFSILFNKQFMVLPLVGEFSRMNDRLYTVTEKLGLMSRVSNNLDVLCEYIDYKLINDMLETQRDRIHAMFSNICS